MNARRDSSDESAAGSFGGRALLIGAVVFAAAATALLVLTDEQRWLRLGIVAALWAALTGAFLAARYRRQVTDQREALAERQQIYELELEREIAARREHELTVEAEAKRKAEEASREDIAALRAELQNMRQTLESLLGGEFLVERYALRAESTRMRSLGEDRSLAMKHLPAAVVQPANVVVPPATREGDTELIERVLDVPPKPRREGPPQRQEPRVADSRPPSVPRRPERPVRPERPSPEPAKPAAARQEHPAEVSDRWFVPDGLLAQEPAPTPEQTPPTTALPAQFPPTTALPTHMATTALPTPQPPRRSEQPRRQEPQRPTDPPPRRPTPGWDTGEQEWAPSWEKARHSEHAQAHHTGAQPAVGADRSGDWLARYNQASTAGETPYVPTQPTPVAEDPAAGATPEESGGRRRRAEGQPSWQETVGRGAADESTGSHASGRSVSELLATHGVNPNPRRRRRRED